MRHHILRYLNSPTAAFYTLCLILCVPLVCLPFHALSDTECVLVQMAAVVVGLIWIAGFAIRDWRAGKLLW